VGILLVPQGWLHAMIAGLPPVYGFTYTGFSPCFLCTDTLGTSKQISVDPWPMDSLLVAAGFWVLCHYRY